MEKRCKRGAKRCKRGAKEVQKRCNGEMEEREKEDFRRAA